MFSAFFIFFFLFLAVFVFLERYVLVFFFFIYLVGCFCGFIVKVDLDNWFHVFENGILLFSC